VSKGSGTKPQDKGVGKKMGTIAPDPKGSLAGLSGRLGTKGETSWGASASPKTVRSRGRGEGAGGLGRGYRKSLGKSRRYPAVGRHLQWKGFTVHKERKKWVNGLGKILKETRGCPQPPQPGKGKKKRETTRPTKGRGDSKKCQEHSSQKF